MNHWTLFLQFLRLGLTSFGGPIAHLGYFHDTFVKRLKWLPEKDFANIVSLCQILPGPTSSQVGMLVGYTRSGRWGACVAWLGFTIPSALMMLLLAYGFGFFQSLIQSPIIHALKLSAVAVVLHAVASMAKTLCPDRLRASIAFTIFLASHVLSFHGAQIFWIGLGGVIGFFLPKDENLDHVASQTLLNQKQKLAWLPLFTLVALIALLPLISSALDSPYLTLFDKLFRSGALVFGGGHVVLPLLVAEFSAENLIAKDVLLAGYGAAQALPGPLFSVASFLGATLLLPQGAILPFPSGANISLGFYEMFAPILGSAAALVAIFLPSFLLLFWVFPVWNKLKESQIVRGALTGINAAVVGVLAAVLLDPLTTQLLSRWSDLALVLLSFLLMRLKGWPSWAVVLLNGGLAFGIALILD